MYIDKHYPFEVLPLPYSTNSLEPYLDEKTLMIHHDELYRRYVENLNRLLAPYPTLHSWTLDEILFNGAALPEDKKADIMHNAGGVYNHQVYFDSMTPEPAPFVSCPLKRAFENTYGSFNQFFKEFFQTAKNLIGSGYVFLVCNERGEISIFPTKNQETTIPLNLFPLMGIDMWEHAYFCKYPAKKEQYINAFFQILNWQYINNEYVECLKFVNKDHVK